MTIGSWWLIKIASRPSASTRARSTASIMREAISENGSPQVGCSGFRRSGHRCGFHNAERRPLTCSPSKRVPDSIRVLRSEEHTSELQSRGHLVCRLLLEKKQYVV